MNERSNSNPDQRSNSRSSVLEVLAFMGFLLAMGTFVFGGIFLWQRVPVTVPGVVGWLAGALGITATWLTYALGAESKAYRALFDVRALSAFVFAIGTGLELLHAWQAYHLIGPGQLVFFMVALLIAVVGETAERRKVRRHLAQVESKSMAD